MGIHCIMKEDFNKANLNEWMMRAVSDEDDMGVTSQEGLLCSTPCCVSRAAGLLYARH